MITSFIDGRVRIRAAALKDPESMAVVLSLIQAQDGVTNVSSNPRTGSVLVEYDPEKIPRETLLEAAAMLEKQLAPVEAKMKEAKRAKGNIAPSLASLVCRGPGRGGRVSPLSPLSESALMGGIFLLTAATGFTSRRLHIALGVAFAAIAGIHLYDRRRCL